MPPDGSSTKSSLQENSGMDKDLSTPPDFSDSPSLSSGEDEEERRETSSFISYTNSLPRSTHQHHPTTGAMQIGNPRSFMQQSQFNSYPHSLPPSMPPYGGRMDSMHGIMHGRPHAPSSVVSATSSYHQQPLNHSAHMYNHLADRPHIDRQLLERQQMDRLQAIERQKQMERQVPMSRPNPMEFDRQFQYPSGQPPPVPPGTQRPQPLYPRGSQEWSPNNVGRQRNFSWQQQEDETLKERQVEAQRRLMQQESSRRVHMIPQHGVYHADSLQHLHMIPSHSSANDGMWNPRHPLNYHGMEHDQHMGSHVGPYLHQSGGRHSYSAVPSGRDILGPPPSMYHHQQQQGSFQRPSHHRVAHHSSYGSGQQPPPQNHEQPDKKNFSVIQV